MFLSVLFWVGIIFLVDGSLGLLFQERWKKLAKGVDIQRIAFVEIGLGVVVLGVHYVLLLIPH